MKMLTVSPVLKTLLNSIWVFINDNNTETRKYGQKHEPSRTGVFHLGEGVMMCTVMVK